MRVVSIGQRLVIVEVIPTVTPVEIGAPVTVLETVGYSKVVIKEVVV